MKPQPVLRDLRQLLFPNSSDTTGFDMIHILFIEVGISPPYYSTQQLVILFVGGHNSSIWNGCGCYTRPWRWLLWKLVSDIWAGFSFCMRGWALYSHRSLASEHVCVAGAVYSLHSTVRDARICYMRALVKGLVCFIYDDGLLEVTLKPFIPDGVSMKAWWNLGWQSWDAEEGNNLPVPTITP